MKKLVYIAFIFSSLLLNGQENVQDSSLNCKDNLVFHFQNANFVKDNEYFNDIVEGYTLIGLWTTPTISYNITDKATIEGGLHALKYSGQDNFNKILPVYRIDYRITPTLCFTLGTLHFNDNHLQPAPMLDPERFYFGQADNGVQFMLNKPNIQGDLWLSWDNFTWYGDSAQEKLTTGLALNFNIPVAETFSFKIPANLIATHLGGQINRPKKPIETLINFSSGLFACFKIDLGIFKELSFGSRAFIYNKNTQVETRPFKSGYAILPEISVSSGLLDVSFSYWYSHKFIGPRGEAMYQCISTQPERMDTLCSSRKIGVIKVNYTKKIVNALSFKCGFEGYQIPDQKLFDYNFSLSFICQIDKILLRPKASK